MIMVKSYLKIYMIFFKDPYKTVSNKFIIVVKKGGFF